MLKIEHLTKTFGDRRAVDDLSLEIGKGDVLHARFLNELLTECGLTHLTRTSDQRHWFDSNCPDKRIVDLPLDHNIQFMYAKSVYNYYFFIYF